MRNIQGIAFREVVCASFNSLKYSQYQAFMRAFTYLLVVSGMHFTCAPFPNPIVVFEGQTQESDILQCENCI